MIDNKCPVCGMNNIERQRYSKDFVSVFYTCPNCGRFEVDVDEYSDISHYVDKNKLSSYLYYNNGKSNIPIDANRMYFFNFIGSEKNFNKLKEKNSFCFHVTRDIIENWYPKTFNEKINYFLLNLYNRQNYFGEGIRFTKEELNSACFITTYDNNGIKYSPEIIANQVRQFIDYLEEQKYIESSNYMFALTVIGLQRVEELERGNTTNKNVFVSMAFNDKTNDIREAIKKGIINAGYSHEFIDEIIHNKQIVPEMFRLIRESRFLVLEISDPNYGAYYEAGYALGLGKEVIICCNEAVFQGNVQLFDEEITTDELEKFGKYLKPHFDIAQKQILVWKDYEDLSNKLSEWIKAII